MERQEIVCSYAAGFFDGEGCVIYHRGKYPTICITQNDTEPLDYIRIHFGGTVHTRSNQKSHDLKIFGDKAIMFARAIKPYSHKTNERLDQLASKEYNKTRFFESDFPVLAWHDMTGIL